MAFSDEAMSLLSFRLSVGGDEWKEMEGRDAGTDEVAAERKNRRVGRCLGCWRHSGKLPVPLRSTMPQVRRGSSDKSVCEVRQ